MEKILSEVLEQNKRIIEQNRKMQEQIVNLSTRIQSLEKKIEFANAVSIVNNRTVSILTGTGNLFDEMDQIEASQIVKDFQAKEEQNLMQLIEMGRTKYE